MSSSTESWDQIQRGVAEIISEKELQAKLKKSKPLHIKLGVDPTAPDLHLGHLVVLRKLKTFQELGHQIEFIIGDFTARIGDPSGQSVTRPALKPQEIWEHSKTYQEQVFKVLDKDKTQVRYNSTWLNALGIPGLLDLARRTTVAQMMQREDFAKRDKAGQPVSLLELMYPVLQGYDSVAVQADVELGGTDQKFNLLMGRELQQEYKQEQQVVMMLPLLEGLDGVRKMSKSYGNYVAFNDPPKDMFGKLMSIPDALMPKYFELLTDVDVASTKKMHPRDAKVLLAKTLTEQFHSEAAATSAKADFESKFSKKEFPQDADEHPEPFDSTKPWPVLKLLADLYPDLSKNEARRLVEQGAVEIDGTRMKLDSTIKLKPGQSHQVKIGKHRFKKIKAAR